MGILVFVGIMAGLVMMPQSASQSQTDMLRKTIDRASRIHNQVMGMLAGPNVKVDGKLPPTFEKVKKNDKDEIKQEHLDRITVLDAGHQNTTIPKRLDELQKELKASLDKTPEARKETRAVAYSLIGQVLAAKAQYHLRCAESAAVQAGQAIAAIDTGILSVQEGLVSIRQITPLTQTRETVADKMKTDAETDITRLESAITAQESAITELQTKRGELLATATKYSNEASELRTLSAVAERDERLKLLEKSFVQQKLANEAGQDAEDTQTKIDNAKSALAIMNLELSGAKLSVVSGTGVLKGFAGNRDAAKGELDKATLAINKTGQEIVGNVDTLMVACEKVDAEQASATQQYVAALEAMKQFRQHASASNAEAISSEAGVLMGKAWAFLSVISARQSVEATNARLKALWETAALEGTPPKTAEMSAFTAKTQGDKKAASDSFAAAAKLYEEATAKADTRFKWSYQCRELRARRARHWLTGDPDDKTRADLLEQQLEELKGFPYVDNAL